MGVFLMPSLGADMEAGKLVEWMVRPGDRVKRGDVIAVVETQKGAIEIECFEEGIVERLEAKLGQELPVGSPLATIIAGGEAPAPAKAKPETPSVPAPQLREGAEFVLPSRPADSPAVRLAGKQAPESVQDAWRHSGRNPAFLACGPRVGCRARCRSRRTRRLRPRRRDPSGGCGSRRRRPSTDRTGQTGT